MAVNLVRKSKNEDEEERRKQLLAQIQQNSQARKDAEIQSVKDMKLNWVDPTTTGFRGATNRIGWIGSNVGAGAKKSILDTLSAPMQSIAVSLQRGANQAAQENSTWDKIKNYGKNALKTYAYTTPDFASRLLYMATIGRQDMINENHQVASQIAQNYNQAQTGFGKAGAVIGGVTSKVVQDNNSLAQGLYAVGQQVGQLIGEDRANQATQKILEADTKLHEKNDKRLEELQRQGTLYGGVTRKLGETGQTIGYMTPSIAIGLATGGAGETAGLVQMGLAAKGSTTREAMQQGADLETAERKGVASGTAEVLSEKMFGGLKAFKPFKESGVEEVAKKYIAETIEKRISSQLGQGIAKTAGNWLVDVTGETIEELTTDIYDTWLDQATTDPNAQYTLDDAINTAVGTTLSTTVLNVGYTGLNKGIQKVYDRNQARANNQESIPEAERIESNGYKENLQEMVNNLNIPEEVKAQIQPMLDSNATINAEEYKDITNNIKTLVKANTQQQIADYGAELTTQYNTIEEQRQSLDNIKPENFKDQESRRFYAQQMNKEFSDNTLDTILATYPENRNGNRTVKQYKEIAKAYGQQMALNGLTFDEVRANTVGAWQYYEPNKNITRYDNKEHKNQSFDRLNSQVWSQEVYDSYRDTMKAQLDQQQKDLADTANARLEEIQDEENILIDTIDNLKPRATAEQVAKTKKLVEDFAKARGVNVEYNAEVFKNSNEEAFIKDNGNGERTIYINPNADPDTILVKLATHEMFHDTIRTEPHDKLTKLVMDKLQEDENYNMYRQSVIEAYQEQLEGKTQAEQDAIIDEEMTAKYLGEYLGDEQFVQQLVNSTNRSTIQKIMDWIDNRLQQIKNVVTGNKEAEYWRKVRENFEKAYNSKYQGQEGTQYSKELENQESLFNMPTEDTKKSETIKAYEDFIDRYNQQFEKAKEIIQQQIPNLKMSNIINQKNSTSGSRIQITTPDGKKVFLYYEGGGEFVIGNGEKRALTNQKKGMIGGLEEVIDYIKSDILNENKRYSKKTSFDEALQQDNKGRELSEEQQEYFKDSKVRDENGNLLEVYHGTKANGVNVFKYDPKNQTGTDYGKAFYFTTDYTKAQGYQYNVENDPAYKKYNEEYNKLKDYAFEEGISEEEKNKRIKELSKWLDSNSIYDIMNDENYTPERLPSGETKKLYLNITNPYTADAKGKYYYEVYDKYFEEARKNNNDGIIVKNVIDVATGEHRPIDVYIAFNENQIKNVDNLKPTDNPDIRYSKKTDFDKALKQDNQGRELSENQQEYFKNSKARDENGQLTTVYHGTNRAGFTTFNRNYNYYTDSKKVAKSYTQGIEMVDTRRLENINDAKNWLKEIGINDMVEIRGTEVYDKFVDEALINYENEESLLKNLKNDLINEIGNPEAGGTYEGYVNIENPVEIDAQNEAWSKIPVDSIKIKGIDNIQELLNKYGSDTWEEDGKIVTSTNDIVDAIKSAVDDGDLNADGVIIRNVRDEGGYGNVLNPKEIATDYITFNPNQFKAMDNKTPTNDADIRYSKKTKFDEALQNNIETTNNGKNLLALHNLNEDKLRGVLELGGFPVPSIAVTNPNIVNHNQFGNITVVFNKDTINPEADSRNEVYDRDVWSPTFPTIEYDINVKPLSKVRNIVGGYGNEYLSRANSKLNNIEEIINRNGYEGLKEDLKDNKDFKYVYYKTLNPDFKIFTKTDTKDVSTRYSNEFLQEFIDEYGKEIPNWGSIEDSQRKEIVNKFKEKWIPLLEQRRDAIIEEENKKENPRMFIIGMAKSSVDSNLEWIDSLGGQDKLIEDLNEIQRTGGTKEVNDYQKTNDYINDNINQKDYEKWIDDNFKEIVGKKGIYNGKEYLTSQGNRRTFNQLHEDYNLRNLVKEITKQSTIAGETGFGAGQNFGTLQAKMANKFNSIEDIKNAESKIQYDENSKELMDNYSDKIYDYMNQLREYSYNKDHDYYYGDNAGYALNDFADYKTQNVENLKKALENNGINSKEVPNELLNNVVNTINDLKNIPTDYFEAKPQRAVDFSEIDTVILPSNTSEDIKQALTDRGIKYTEYDSNNENARNNILKSLDEYKFNKKATAFDDYLKANNPNRSGVTIGDLKNLPTKQQKTTQPILPTTNVQPTTESLEIPNEQTSLPLGEQVNPSERKQREAYKSIIESPYMSEEAKKVARKFIGQDTYTPDSNLKQLERADNIISRLGVEKALNQLESNAMEGRTIKAEDIATGDRLIEYYSKIGDSENLQRAIRATAMAGTQAGRSVQAFALLKHQTPQGMAVWIQNSVDKLNSQTKNGQFDFTTEMQEKILNSTEDNLQENVDEVMKELGQQVPQSLLGKLDTWRYFSMLANPKTHIRNIVGNFAMGLTQQVKSKVAGTIEQVTGQDRTHTSLFEKRSRANIDFAKNDLKNVSAQLGIGESKYSNPKNQIQQNQRVFKSDALEKSLGRMFKLNDNLLEAEDNFGLKNAYVRNLSDYMTANKLNPNTITNEQLQQARKVAVEEALRATFHQESSLASMLNQLEKKNGLTRTLVGGLVPFKKTPINVAKSGFEYSPAGLAKAIVYDSVQLRKGNINVNEYIDNISKGLTGTGIALVGYALAEAGILKAGGDDDKEDKYKEAMGEQEYSINNKPLKELLKKVGINVPDSSYSLDWLAPTGIPLFVGAELNKLVHDTTEKEGETQNEVLKAIGRVTDATSSLLNPMSEMSMISGLTSTIQSFSTDPGGALMNLVVSPVKSYVGQVVPTAVGQVARTMDKYERDTSSTETGLLPKAIDQTKNQIMNKIPGLRQLLPTKKDIWGNEVETQDYFHNAVLPYTKKEVKTNAVDKELNDLYERTGESIYPNTSLSKTVTYEGSKTRLTNQDYNEFKTNYGKTSYKLLEDLTKSQEYKGMTDAQKVQAIKDVYTYANNLNKTEYAEKKGIEFKTPTDVQQVRAVKAYGGKESDYFKYKGITDGLSKDSEKMVALRDSNLSAKSKRAVYSATLGKDDTLFQSTNIDVNEYLGYKTANIQGTKDSSGKTISGTKKTAQLDYINNNISGYENRLLLMGKDYKLSRSQQQDLAEYIYTLDNADDLFAMYDKNFTVRDGTVYYK